MADTVDRESMTRFLLRHVDLLKRVADEARQTLTAGFTVRVLSPGDVLIRHGDRPRGLNVVHSGLLEVSVEGREEVRHRIGWRTRGDVIGEAGLLGGKSATETVTARRHAVVLTLDPAACESVLGTYRELAAELALGWMARLSLENRRPRPGAFVFTAVELDRLRDPEITEELLAEACERCDGATFLAQHDALEALADGSIADPLTPDLVAWLHDGEADARVALTFAADADGAWGKTCLARADCVLALLPDVPEPGVVIRARQVLDTARRSDLVLLSRRTPGEASTAWSAEIDDRRLVEIPADNVEQTAMLLDMLHESHGNLDQMRQFPVFAKLRDQELELIHDEISVAPVPGGETLMEQDEESDDVFLVASGRFRATRMTSRGPQPITEFGPGETMGDISSLSGATRIVTVRAVRDSFVGRISGARFRALLDEIPAMSRGLNQQMAERLRVLGPRLEPLTTERPPANVAVIPLDASGPASAFGRELGETMAALGVDVAVVDPDRVDAQLGRGVSETVTEGPSAAILERWLHRLEQRHEVVLYLARDRDSAWARRCVRQADLVLFVAGAGDDPGLRAIERPLYDAESWMRMPHLVLLHPAAASEGRGTARWLEPRPGASHHHVRTGNRQDAARVARRILLRAVGIAFSGASSRGVAHLGVARGLAHCGFPLDLTSGSSSGAAVAAIVTLGLSHEEMLRHAMAFLEGIGPKLHRLQPPLTALMSGKAFETHLRDLFGDRRLEDQLVPCTLTGVDLNRHRLARMRSGPIWLAVRASCSLPFFWPPVWFEDSLLVDGGILSNMPIDEILTECAGGLAVASDLNVGAGEERPAFDDYERYGATLSNWRQLGEKLSPGGRKRRYPSVGDVVLHAMCIPSFQQQARVERLAEEPSVRFVRPPLPYEGFFSVDLETSRRYEQLAYDTAVRELAGAQVLTLPESQ